MCPIKITPLYSRVELVMYSDMKTVNIFKTNVPDRLAATHIMLTLQQTFPGCKVNFDLDDCDRILRIESQQDLIVDAEIRLLMAENGYDCAPLPD